ncbi:putative Xanthine dehydrogenase accessory protein XdhC [Vibrio nigripulchritudo MADA3029]|uniref:xanthine dehydrogenase accessory protein XdhC n=1 Tax=Vibrio nigripulchritudo TaxID=28173 RepID=UPI0003B20AD1|nr:xanthine dehydrogenase accessory protein XdhC [Vibrio nigripulchritudo]CCN49540.1 putative Xanthine dehydrogenase accessory protein XdhC [Vibrio nigripulchritudo MADA3020]CCN51377.1 putative Xanthine dehydrogenase accessory protein XdhC [Vibrio nigripulchritudo MADA3021]CCN60012.1 putative Xanthine dehydrogenase accessory protein XdhC [Vibrio nigripulchritudo MADA3029]CCN69461.1 putative Xanthine dehydrogenase accessory protein XdhC [Vibrio nigripulchritudo SFn118]
MYNDNWIQELAKLEKANQACVMVTVLDERGSVPRGVGTKMLITEDRLIATIGGGHLEHLATQMARQMLEDKATDVNVETFNLGARLGQCCGGMATLCFEPIGTRKRHLYLFGAGHVAKALVNVVATLDFEITWIDQREHEFPSNTPANVEVLVSDDPVGEVNFAHENSYFLVMTHNHQLDFDLTRAILDREDSCYFGVIGSATKRKKFDMRLKQRGYKGSQLETMTSPIGLSDVPGKLPAEIAVSVAGELIAHYQAEEARIRSKAQPSSNNLSHKIQQKQA